MWISFMVWNPNVRSKNATKYAFGAALQQHNESYADSLCDKVPLVW